MRKIIEIGILLILTLSIAGCGNQAFGSSAEPADSGDASSQSSAAPSSENKAGGEESGNQAAAPQTQQEALEQTEAALNTEVPLLLPTSLPVEEGRYLSAAADSQKAHYEVKFYETDRPAELNSAAASKGRLIATVTGTEYGDASAAQDSIDGYMQVDTSGPADSIVDLGHSIKAVGDGGAGHMYLQWNEGRWCIDLDSPNDPAYKNDEYPDSRQLAEDIVAYLDGHMLPAPQKIGVIHISIWNTAHETTVEWQNSKTVYQVVGDDPMKALKAAVAMEAK